MDKPPSEDQHDRPWRIDGRARALLSLGVDDSPADSSEEADQPTAVGGGGSSGSRNFHDIGELTPGTIVGERFRIIAPLGRGGMGAVYRADDLKLGQPVALKFLAPGMVLGPEVERSFYDEVRIGRQIAHPNVCRIYDLLEVEGRPVVVMELVDGENLASLLKRIGRLSHRKAVEVARDICAGVDAAHEKGIVHGDLKPANIMIDGRGRARVTDFGLARFAGQRRVENRTVAGTLIYMAPEQFVTGDVSQRADLYALGLVLYEIFTGVKARTAATIEELRASFAIPPPPPSVHQPRMQPEVEKAILRCLSSDPEERPASAKAVLASFPAGDVIESMIAAGETPSPEFVAASRKSPELQRSQAWTLLAAALASLILLLIASQHLTLYGRTRLARRPEALADRAHEIAERISFIGVVRDEAYWFAANLQHLRGRVPDRGELADWPLPPIVFHYRASPSPMLPRLPDGRVRSNDPPLDQAGMVHLGLTPAGRLVRLRSILPESAESVRGAAVSWEEVFEEAGLDPTVLVAIDSGWIPPVPYDQKREWRGESVSVRAARYRQRLVFFETIPAGVVAAASMRELRLPSHLIYYLVLAAALAAGGVLARRNIRGRRVDSSAAMRIALWVFGCRALYGLIAGHHPLTVDQESQFLAGIAGTSLLLAAQVWLGYVALEPYVRRRLPETLIGWSRVIRGRLRDPVVGRDLLVGALAGVLLRMIDHIRNVAPAFTPFRSIPSHLSVEALASMKDALAGVFLYQARAVFYALFALFVLVILRMILRHGWMASLAWLLAMTLTFSRWDDPRLDIPIVALQMGLILFILKSLGLLAAAVAIYVQLLTLFIPLTADPRAFYFGQSFLAVAIVLGFIAFGFRASLAGKPALAQSILDA